MTPEKTFALHPEYFVCFVIGSLLLLGLIEQKDFSNRRDEQKINFSKADKFI